LVDDLDLVGLGIDAQQVVLVVGELGEEVGRLRGESRPDRGDDVGAERVEQVREPPQVTGGFRLLGERRVLRLRVGESLRLALGLDLGAFGRQPRVVAGPRARLGSGARGVALRLYEFERRPSACA
jgi:hypothetical protein